jgi:hypothetical protein
LPFSPTAVDVSVQGGKDDDFAAQHLFFREFIEEWPKLRESIYAFISKQDWKREPQSSENNPTLSLVRIPKGRLEDADWRIFFDCSPEGGGSLLTVDMKGREPVAFAVDG